jgi:hypothetical protein
MPKRSKKDTTVVVKVGDQFNYGYKGFESPEAVLGQVQFTEGLAPTKSIAYYPVKKPLVATKVTATGKTSREYVAATAVAAAIAAGWNVVASYRGVRRLRVGRPNARTQPVCVKLASDLWYCWNMRKDTYTALGASGRTLANIVDYVASARENDGAYGANYVVLKEEFDGIPGGVIIPRKVLLATVAGADGLDHRVYSGVDPA